MPIITLRQIQLGFGGPPLLDGVDFSIEPGERVCLIGRNGEGKSTLMKVIAGELRADDGDIAIAGGAQIARLTQEVPEDLGGNLFDLVADGLGDIAGLIKRYHQASQQVAEEPSERHLELLSRVQHELEAADGWQLEQRVETVLSRLSLDAEADFASLSGGLKRRVLLARALVRGPDLLLLDEPTNHLDIESIQWLEEFLLGWDGALLFVTHDRAFLRRLATRIVELDRGRASDWPGDYDNYLRRREERDHAEAKANERFDKKLAQEEVWIRQGIKARRTRNEGRVRQLKALREEFSQRRSRQGSANIRMAEADRSGKLVCEARNVSYAWDGTPVVRDFSTTILRGDRIGIIGPNGAGKTTLLNLLLGKLTPNSGEVELGTRLEIAYFDQLRAQLDTHKTVLDNVAGGSDKVTLDGQSRHVISYLQDFLFPPERCRQPVSALSGGERNRLLLAKLFTKPANLLVMDEPTNDLDVETLELLEDRLMAYQGTLLLVSHDRAFLDNVVTSTLVFEGDGRIGEYVGGYEDWLRQAGETRRAAARPEAGKSAKPAAETEAVGKPERPRKLSYKEQRELESLPALIEQMEEEQSTLQASLADPDLYRDRGEEVPRLNARLVELESALGEAYARWESLESPS